MWRRHSIANKKAAWDAEKSKNYAKIGKLLEIAARQWWKDPGMNPQLDLMLQKARQYNLPKEVVDKAIKKWAWELDGENIQEVLYEWYGPSWSAMYIKCIASNTNRTTSTVRAILAKMWWSIAEPWAVSWQFSLKGVIIINGKQHNHIVKWNEVRDIVPYAVIELEEDLLSLDIEDFQEEDGMCRVITSREAFIWVRKELDKMLYSITDADLQYLPQNEITLSETDYTAFENIVNALEDDEDVDSVYHNVW
jgi:YebC/PmpR family DNA-binding regulatory protein